MDCEWARTADNIWRGCCCQSRARSQVGQSSQYGLKLVERGPEMEAIVHVFETWTKNLPRDIISRIHALAIKLYSVIPVSMADGRTISTMTWLNSPTRSRQDITTLKERIQIRQWHLICNQSVAPTVTPSVK
ncbi:hypothetical protein EDB19DRAFT_1677697 [Suillus lakei]|nr:hypothetical protein EDB19DRAFT_1677697 [Suillus lakei]